jgi:DNA-binding GntR family transcriptional regulator
LVGTWYFSAFSWLSPFFATCWYTIGHVSNSVKTSPGLRPLTGPTSRTDLVAKSVRDAILSGELEPGETLVERRLSELLGVSKTPVREALIGLAHSGLVTVAPNRGITVRRLTPEDLYEVYEVRLLLEPWAVRTSAHNRDPEVLADAQDALNEAAGLLGSDDRARLSVVNRRFHRALYSRCDNELVVAQLDGLRDLTALGTVHLLWDRWPTWRDEFVEHAEILSAVSNGDESKAENLLREHIQESLTKLAKAQQGS